MRRIPINLKTIVDENQIQIFLMLYWEWCYGCRLKPSSLVLRRFQMSILSQKTTKKKRGFFILFRNVPTWFGRTIGPICSAALSSDPPSLPPSSPNVLYINISDNESGQPRTTPHMVRTSVPQNLRPKTDRTSPRLFDCVIFFIYVAGQCSERLAIHFPFFLPLNINELIKKILLLSEGDVRQRNMCRWRDS